MSERRARWVRLVTQPRLALGAYLQIGRILVVGGSPYLLPIAARFQPRVVDLDERRVEREALMRKPGTKQEDVYIDLTAEEANNQSAAAERMEQHV